MSMLYVINSPVKNVKADSKEGYEAANELIALLGDLGLPSPHLPAKEVVLNISSLEVDGFVCNISQGIYVTRDMNDHAALMNRIHQLNNRAFFRDGKSGYFNPSGFHGPHLGAEHFSASPNMAPQFSASAFTSALSTAEVRAEFVKEIKSKYRSGSPLTLMESLILSCTFCGRKPSADERSRVKLVADFLNDPYLHELTREHFSAYENHYISSLNARTIEERIALIKRIFKVLLQKQTFFGDNPLQHWTPTVTSAARKAKAAQGIASMERVQDVFGSREFAEFGESHRSFYLIMMIAIITGMRITSICRLNSSDFLETIEGTPIIDLSRDKTETGKRQIPIPRHFHSIIKSHLAAHGTFGIEDRGERKGCSDAIAVLYAEFLNQFPQFNLSKLNPHGLRASLNNYLSRIGVPFDIRCAVLGHKNRHVNSVHYCSPLSADMVAEKLNGMQDRLLAAMKFDAYEFTTETQDT